MNLLDSPRRRRLLFAALYLSEGAPIGFIWWTLPTRLRMAEVPVERITALTAALALPWALKFLWAPAVDILRSRRWGFRAWILAAQGVMGLSLLPLAFLDFATQFPAVYACLMVHALAAATQDVGIDGFAIAVTDDAERGLLNGWMQAGMLGGRWLFSGGVLLAGSLAGDRVVVPALVAVIWACSTLLILARPPGTVAGGRSIPGLGTRARDFRHALGDAVRSRRLWLGLGFALTGGAAFEALGAVAGPLLVDLGFSQGGIGAFYSANVAAMLLGALMGGRFADRRGHRQASLASLGALAVLVASVALAARGGETAHRDLVFGLMIAAYVGIGAFTASSYALFMDLTDRRLGATQFSAFMGATNLCEAWSGWTVGRLIPRLGYPLALATMAMASLAALPFLLGLREKASSADRSGSTIDS